MPWNNRRGTHLLSRDAKSMKGKGKGVKQAKAPPAKAKLDALGIEWVCEKIVERVSMTDISREAGVDISTLIVWLDGDVQRSARAREAREQTAKLWDEQATRVIEEATDSLSLARAKELAHHYRWRASKIAPRAYGDKVQTELSGPDGGPVQAQVQVVPGLDPFEAYRLLKAGGKLERQD